MQTKQRDFHLETTDGECRSTYYYPDASGKFPGVVLLMDGIGLRPALGEMAKRMAAMGYAVLLPDLFYRAGAYEAQDAQALLHDPEKRNAFFGKYFASITSVSFLRDMASFIAFLDRQPEVDIKRKLAAVGYCMGGGLAIAAAGTFPARVGLAASFHGGRLATDEPDSPHHLASKIKGYVYVGGAVDDQSFPDAMKVRLDAALTVAGVPHKIETYEGARHGWVPTDTPAYDRDAAERHWKTLEQLFATKL